MYYFNPVNQESTFENPLSILVGVGVSMCRVQCPVPLVLSDLPPLYVPVSSRLLFCFLGHAPVSKEAQCRCKRDLPGSKRDLHTWASRVEVPLPGSLCVWHQCQKRTNTSVKETYYHCIPQRTMRMEISQLSFVPVLALLQPVHEKGVTLSEV